MGFFAPSETLDKSPTPSSPRCGACGLHKTCESPKMELSGEGRRKILIVGEAPGADEDEEGIPFIGRAGKQLANSLWDAAGIKPHRDCWITNALRCRLPENRDPTPDELRACQPNLIKAIEQLKPEIIMPLGKFGIMAVIGLVWKEAVGSANRWLGWQIPCQEWNAWICPTWHPAYIMRKLEEKGATNLLFERHLAAVGELGGRPWEVVPDYASQVKIEMNHREAAIWLDDIKETDVIAFDYETNMLKPDSKRARIYSCAVCVNGERTLAYPWFGYAAMATGALLRSQVRKIGANIKFEERWTKRVFGHGVRNWVWDCNLGAHIIDHRTGITSVKFQGFVLLGQALWNDRVEQFFQGPSNEPNNIGKIDLTTLLRYNGMDAVVEYHVAKKQKEWFR